MSRRAWVLGSLLIVAGACSGSRATGPAWPKLHAVETDGGESLAPRPTTQIAAAVAEDHAPAAVEVPVAAPAPGSAAAPAAAAPAIVAPTEEITTEDIVIEVDE